MRRRELDHRVGLGRRVWRSQSPLRAVVAEALSPREREVLDLLAAGLTDRQIAQRLLISHDTVQNHLASVRDKTGRRRWELAAVAARLSAAMETNQRGGRASSDSRTGPSG